MTETGANAALSGFAAGGSWMESFNLLDLMRPSNVHSASDRFSSSLIEEATTNNC